MAWRRMFALAAAPLLLVSGSSSDPAVSAPSTETSGSHLRGSSSGVGQPDASRARQGSGGEEAEAQVQQSKSAKTEESQGQGQGHRPSSLEPSEVVNWAAVFEDPHRLTAFVAGLSQFQAQLKASESSDRTMQESMERARADMDRARQEADKQMQQAKEQMDKAMEDARKGAEESKEDVDSKVKEAREKARKQMDEARREADKRMRQAQEEMDKQLEEARKQVEEQWKQAKTMRPKFDVEESAAKFWDDVFGDREALDSFASWVSGLSQNETEAWEQKMSGVAAAQEAPESWANLTLAAADLNFAANEDRLALAGWWHGGWHHHGYGYGHHHHYHHYGPHYGPHYGHHYGHHWHHWNAMPAQKETGVNSAAGDTSLSVEDLSLAQTEGDRAPEAADKVDEENLALAAWYGGGGWHHSHYHHGPWGHGGYHGGYHGHHYGHHGHHWHHWNAMLDEKDTDHTADADAETLASVEDLSLAQSEGSEADSFEDDPEVSELAAKGEDALALAGWWHGGYHGGYHHGGYGGYGGGYGGYHHHHYYHGPHYGHHWHHWNAVPKTPSSGEK